MERAEAEEILDGDRETAVALLLRVGELVEANQRLEARVGELERRLNRSSRNSSLPPSQDPPSAPPRPGGRRSGRGRGGQPGHKGSHRPLLAPERVDEVVEHWPERCRSCAHVFGEPERVDAAEPWRQQVTELPTIAVRVTEHRLHGVRCPACATRTRAELPRGVPRSAFGPRLQAAVVTLAVRNRVSRRDTTELARELFGAELSTGTVDAIVHRAGEALAGPYTQLEQRIKSASVVNIDETGWRTAGGNRTLWGALTSQTAVFRIAAGRHGFEARTLLGERFAGIVCSDRWRGYDYLEPSQRQLCWAHLARDFTAHSEGLAAQKEFGEAGLAIAASLFEAWDSYQHHADRDRLQAQTAPLQDTLRTLLEHAARKSTKTKYHRLFAKNLLKRWPALWTFTHTHGVEPTNNHAERGLRGAVIYRKLSLGSQSEQGERTIERLLSASVTCRLRRRSLFAYLTDVLSASIRGDPVPALA
ncbi:MAG: IS66 family transposase [Actinobacteria bacterium]|nr:IS66 family transposase [Actinomycetota bacterium]